ncbi:MAG: M17 family peptidase N-terminal domain-containing protein [Candidatus Alcyoniella australis]|nr:M17 family peptidase N-terminal domain-containing protein [Candidatus Alcyoniella australis]
MTADPIDALDVETVVLSAFSEERPLKGSSGLIDWRICGRLSRLVMAKRFSAERFETLLFPSEGRIGPSKVIIVGLGPLKEYDFEVYCKVLGYMMQSLVKMNIYEFALPLPGVGLAGLEYTMATERLIEEVMFKYRQRKTRLEDVSVTIVAGRHRLREVGAVLNKHSRAMRDAP